MFDVDKGVKAEMGEKIKELNCPLGKNDMSKYGDCSCKGGCGTYQDACSQCGYQH